MFIWLACSILLIRIDKAPIVSVANKYFQVKYSLSPSLYPCHYFLNGYTLTHLPFSDRSELKMIASVLASVCV